MKARRIVVLGEVAQGPYAGIAWMNMQIAVGLRRLGHDAYYFEATSDWPYDPYRRSRVTDSTFALSYLAKVAESFGIGDRWAYRRSCSDKEWFGLSRAKAEELLAHADAVLNVAGATRLEEIGSRVGRYVFFGTDPGCWELPVANGEAPWITEQHTDFVTYGENIGSADCPVPPLPGLCSRTRQPVLLDLWEAGPPSKPEFTTVGNWRQTGDDIVFQGQTYHWSKHLEFMKVIDLPRRTAQPLELATPLSHLDADTRRLLEANRWALADSEALTLDPWPYRGYIRASRGEFTVAKDLYVRLRTGWFSERSACYLAAGRPVVTQDTGFGKTIPTGEGLFAWRTLDEILAAFDAINSDYERHSRAARAIAEEYFRAETVLAKMLGDLGL